MDKLLGKLGSGTRFALGMLGALLLPVLVVGLTTLIAVKATALPADVAMRVSGTDITREETARQFGVQALMYGFPGPSDRSQLDSFRRNSARIVAVNRVIDLAAVERGLVSNDAAAAAAVNRFAMSGGPEGVKQLDRTLTEMGATQQDMLEEAKRAQLSQQLYQKVAADAGADAPVSDQDVQRFYDRNRAQMADPETRHIRNITVATQADADNVVAQARGGADFAALSSRYSIDAAVKEKGGDRGFLGRDQLGADYGNAAFSAAPGAVFGPVRGVQGWYVGQVLEVRPSVPLNLPDVAEQIRSTLLQLRMDEAWQSWLTQRVKQAHIQYADDLRPNDPDRVVAPPQPGSPNQPNPVGPPAQVGPPNPVGPPAQVGPPAPAQPPR